MLHVCITVEQCFLIKVSPALLKKAPSTLRNEFSTREPRYVPATPIVTLIGFLLNSLNYSSSR